MPVNRVTGTYSGLDTDKLVKDMLQPYQSKIDKTYQDKVKKTWEQEEIRSFVSTFKEFQGNYFDLLKPETNLRSETFFSEFNVNTTISGVSSEKVIATPTASFIGENHSISEINQLATKDIWAASGKAKEKIISESDINILDLNTAITGGKDSITLVIDGISKSIDLSGGYADVDELVTDINNQIRSEFNYSLGSELFKAEKVVGEDRFEFVINGEGHNLKILDVDADTVSSLGMRSGESNYISLDDTLENAFAIVDDADLAFSINGKSDFGITKDDTVSSMINKINSSSAGVTVSFSNLTGEFSLTSNKEGINSNVSLDNQTTIDFFSNKLKIANDANRTQAKNAIFTIDGVSTTRTSNTFNIDGIRYELKETHDAIDDDIEIEFEADTDKISDKILKFVDEYNKIVDSIKTKTEEKQYRSFTPLTEEQRASMSEEDIKLWETKAKSGILRSDTTLSSMATRMRQALYQSVDGVDLTLSQIGIDTTNNYKDGGKLVVDIDKLKTSLDTNYTDVVKLFTANSDKDYGDTDNHKERYQEVGIADKLNDIINDAVRTTRVGNLKGSLLERAGIIGDVTDETSMLSKEITRLEKSVEDMIIELTIKETTYYNKYAAMEKVLAGLQSQSSWLSQQTG